MNQRSCRRLLHFGLGGLLCLAGCQYLRPQFKAPVPFTPPMVQACPGTCPEGKAGTCLAAKVGCTCSAKGKLAAGKCQKTVPADTSAIEVAAASSCPSTAPAEKGEAKVEHPPVVPVSAKLPDLEAELPAVEESKKEAPAAATAGEPAGTARLAHAADYGWLVGELRYLHGRKAWHLRYAPLDQEDPYGGSVTLVETGPMEGFRDGQRVRVEGQLVHPDRREASPAYQVKALKPLPTS